MGARRVRRTIRDLGFLQIDYVNVLVPSHLLVLFSRLGPYDPTLLEDLLFRRRALAEQWARAASIVPIEELHLFRGMGVYDRRSRALAAYMKEHADRVRTVLREVRRRGPVTVTDAGPGGDGAKTARGGWDWSPRKAALEALFARGTLAVAGRRAADAARSYDLAERVFPAEALRRRIRREEAERELVRRAARAHGVATAGDVADYYRFPVTMARRRLDQLVQEGALLDARVQGWEEKAYLDPGARLPDRIDGAALLSPFDPVVWSRERAERLFDFEYRFEIFTPGARRRWGVYVLPFLSNGRLVARVDLKADRGSRLLLVRAAHLEPHAKPEPVARALAAELRELAGWLRLDAVRVGRRGDLARPLARAIGVWRGGTSPG